jgi:hypothetical protein
VRVVVHLKQQGEFNEPAVLGIRLDEGEGYQIRVPVQPDVPEATLEEPISRVSARLLPAAATPHPQPLSPKGRGENWSARDGRGQAEVRVELELPREPLQIIVDPDRVLLDQNLPNNRWRAESRLRLTPLYTQLDEVEVVNAYDQWNFTVGPWAQFSTYNDPWFARSPIAGFRVGAMRLQEFKGGAFVGYRANDRNIIAGADGLWDHVPLPQTQVGFALEQSLETLGGDETPCSRAVVYGRYVLMYASSLYLQPFEYVELFSSVQNRCLPDPRWATPGSNPFDERAGIGIHYHKNMLTPYWDPEAGVAFDLTYQYGLPVFNDGDFHQVYGQISTVKSLPKWFTGMADGPILGPIMDWLGETRFAFRAGGAVATPREGLFFALGGGDQYRGFDLRERQGSATWVGSIEWRLPLVQNVCWDVCDHVAGVRNVYVVPFYDIGDAYVDGHTQGQIAHAFGVGLRLDVTWLGLIERTMLRFDVAKTVNANTPWQFWFGISHPF